MTAGRGDGLEQQLDAQHAIQIVPVLGPAPTPNPDSSPCFQMRPVVSLEEPYETYQTHLQLSRFSIFTYSVVPSKSPASRCFFLQPPPSNALVAGSRWQSLKRSTRLRPAYFSQNPALVPQNPGDPQNPALRRTFPQVPKYPPPSSPMRALLSKPFQNPPQTRGNGFRLEKTSPREARCQKGRGARKAGLRYRTYPKASKQQDPRVSVLKAVSGTFLPGNHN